MGEPDADAVGEAVDDGEADEEEDGVTDGVGDEEGATTAEQPPGMSPFAPSPTTPTAAALLGEGWMLDVPRLEAASGEL